MGKADIFESDYLDNAEIFADLVNGVLYQGERVVKPEELQEQDGELRSILGKNVKKTIRDKVKLWNGTAIAVFAVENQTKVDYHMVLRAMLSEAMAYDRQWKKLKDERKAEQKKKEESFGKEKESGEERVLEKKDLTADEFISGMRKEDKFVPVITIVVYYGQERPWDGARTLYELLDVKGEEKRILPFISDYRLNIFDYHAYEDFGQFHSELQQVFEFLRYANNRKLLEEKMEKQRDLYGKLSNQAKVLLTQITNIKKIPNVKEEQLKKGEFVMCKAFEDMKEEGRLEGLIEGGAREIVEMGQEFGLTDENILRRLQNRLNITIEEAERFFGMFRQQA